MGGKKQWTSKVPLLSLAGVVAVITFLKGHAELSRPDGLSIISAYASSGDSHGDDATIPTSMSAASVSSFEARVSELELALLDEDSHRPLDPVQNEISNADDNRCDRNQNMVSTPADMSGNPPLITVCIPVFEGSLTLEETTRSVLNQTYSNLEILVSFDLSADTEKSKDIIAQLERENGGRDIRITTYSHEKRMGWISNVNFLLLEARGAYVGILPDDDTIPPNFYQELAACLMANPAAVNCFPYIVCQGLSDDQEAERRARLSSTSAASASAYKNPCTKLHQGSIRGSREERIYAALKHRAAVSFRGLVRNGQQQQLPGLTAGELPSGNNMHAFLLKETHKDCYIADMVQIVQHAVAGDLVAVDVPYFKTFRAAQTHRSQLASMLARDKMLAWIDNFANIYNLAHLYTSSSQNFYQACTDNLLAALTSENLIERIDPSGIRVSTKAKPEEVVAIFGQKISEANGNSKRVAILGGGIQGCTMALLFQKHGYDVTIFDKSTDILNRASSNQEGKIHLGFVYSGDKTLKTGIRMMESALRFSSYLEYLVGEKIDWAKWKSSKFHYMVPYDSMLSPKELGVFFGKLQAVYHQMLEKDPAISYLGERPQQLYRPIPLDKTLVNESFFEAAFETEEYAISHAEFKLAIKRALASKSSIHTLLNTVVLDTRREVGNFSAHGSNATFQIVTNLGVHGGFDKVVNCLWEGRHAIDSKMGVPAWSGNNVRLKFGIKTQHIKALAAMPSMTIVNGPYGDFVNYPGDKKMYFSWYPISMHGMVVDNQIPAELHNIADGNISSELAAYQIESHHRSFSELLLPQQPAFQFKCPELVGGFILGNGNSDIQNPESLLHTRCDEPIFHEDSYFSISTQKFTSAPYHAYLLEKRFLSPGAKGKTRASSKKGETRKAGGRLKRLKNEEV